MSGRRPVVKIIVKSIHIHTYIPLTLYPRSGSRGISDIPPRHYGSIVDGSIHNMIKNMLYRPHLVG
jgi:hypothetical protein